MHELDDKRIKRLGWGMMILSGIVLLFHDPKLVFTIGIIYAGYNFVYYGYCVEHFKKMKEDGQFSSEEEMQKEEQMIKEKFAFSSMYLSPSGITATWYAFIFACILCGISAIVTIIYIGQLIIERLLNLF